VILALVPMPLMGRLAPTDDEDDEDDEETDDRRQ
jgi:hypothetical protein